MINIFSDDRRHKSYSYFLHVAWLSGIAAGILPYFSLQNPPFPVARRCFICTSNLRSVFFISLIPVVLSAVFSYFYCWWSVLLLVLLQGFLFSYTRFLVLISFGAACGPISLLLLSTHILCIPVLYSLWLHLARDSIPFPVKHFVFSFAFCLLSGLLDYALVMPFTASLINI